MVGFIADVIIKRLLFYEHCRQGVLKSVEAEIPHESLINLFTIKKPISLESFMIL